MVVSTKTLVAALFLVALVAAVSVSARRRDDNAPPVGDGESPSGPPPADAGPPPAGGLILCRKIFIENRPYFWNLMKS
jgi:hypothetical protein